MIKIVRSELETVAVSPDRYPLQDMPEIAFVGRSNVGKSSLLNCLTNRKKLARVSGSPGKTRTINFYRINDEFRFIDLPGYGYAKVSKSITADWDKMMAAFFDSRDKLKRVVQLVDIRHEPSKLDIKMYDYLRSYGLDGLVCATKADKISSNVKQKNLAIIRKSLRLNKDDKIIPVSSLKRTGIDEMLSAISDEIYPNDSV